MFVEIVKTALAYDGTHPIRVEVKGVRRGSIKRLVVFQSAGTLAGYTYALYTAASACPTDGSSPSADRSLYRITPVKTVAGSVAGTGDDDAYGLDFPFSTPGGSTNAPQTLYLEITPAGGSNTSRFGVAICIESVTV